MIFARFRCDNHRAYPAVCGRRVRSPGVDFCRDEFFSGFLHGSPAAIPLIRIVNPRRRCDNLATWRTGGQGPQENRMRLTLRTLLAYLDDILEPAQTREIGSKVAESKFASDLVERIRDVMRRRRLTAPNVDGGDDSLDANVMAEYLDNTLPPEKVTDVEKRCLESDIHLAEAAACHQILTLVLGEPVEIAPESRRRMYGLASSGNGDEPASIAAETPMADAVEPEPASAYGAASEAETPQKGESAIPEYLRPRPVWQRAVPVLVAVLAVGLLIALIVFDPAFNRRWGLWGGGNAEPEPAVAQNQNELPPPQAGSNEPANSPNANGPATGAAPSANAEGSNPGEAATGVGGPGVRVVNTPGAESPVAQPSGAESPKPPADQQKSVTKNEPGGGAKKSKTQTPPPGTEMASTVPRPGAASPSQAETNPKAAERPKPVLEAARVEPAPEVKLVSKTGVLLGYDSARDDWFVLARPGLKLPAPEDTSSDTITIDPTAKARVPRPPSPMSVDRRADQLVAPEPFDSVLELGDGLCRVWVLGGTSVQLLAPTGGTRFGLEPREGKVVIKSGGSKMPGTEYRPLRIALKLGEEVLDLTFLRPETQCGLEIVPSFPTKPGEDVKDIGHRGGLYVVSGDLRVTEPAGRQRTLTSGRWISLSPGDRAVATDLAGATFRPKGTPTLTWLFPESRHLPTAQAKMTKDFEADFLPDQPVSSSIGTLAKNEPNPKIAELAAKTLALTGQYAALVEILAQVPHEEAVHAAANGLRAWLPLAPDHAALLQKELVTAFPPGPRSLDNAMDDRAIVMRLLWGFDRDDARDRKTSSAARPMARQRPVGDPLAGDRPDSGADRANAWLQAGHDGGRS